MTAPSVQPVHELGRARIPSGAMVRVPAVTLLFWVVKLVSTGVGEATSDHLVKTYNPLLVVLAAASAFVVCFVVQFTAKRYVPWRYWLFVTMVAIFGTMVADVIHIALGVPYWASTCAFAVILACLFVVWRRLEGTLSVHSITTGRREFLYWSVVLATFALGTSFGDLTATTAGLGYLGSAFLFTGLFLVPGIIFRLGHLPATAAFWWAYVMTRPLGASVADWLGTGPDRGGLGIGSAAVSAVGVALIAALVMVMQHARPGDGRPITPGRV